GHAYAEGASLHGREDGHWKKESKSIWFWGCYLPVLAFGLAMPSGGLSLLLLLGYPALFSRIFIKQRRQNISSKHAALYAISCVLGKFAQVGGTLSFLRSKLLGTKSQLIEYKN
ncbi:MAG TPA: glycosyltransferase family 2 protein, partial [Candidatus Sericytochromatia bacterium]